MSKPHLNSTDIKTQAFVLRRTNYGETDRILNLLTPEGKISCLAKGVRKEKSKLAGGIEIFTLSNIVLHKSHQSDLHLLTSAKMETFYGNILKDLDRFELASKILKNLARVTDQVDSPEFFDLLKQSLEGLNENYHPVLVQTWFNFNLVRIRGDQINLLTDTSGTSLQEDQRYIWDSTEEALRPLAAGNIGSAEIKLARLMLVSPLKLVAHVKNLQPYLDSVFWISKNVI